MLLEPEDIQEFKTLYEDDTGKSITIEEAREMASRLLRFYQVLLQAAHRHGPLETTAKSDMLPEEEGGRPSDDEPKT